MRKNSGINPDLLTVYASLAFVIGALITLASSIIAYRTGQPSQPGVADVAEIDRPAGIR